MAINAARPVLQHFVKDYVKDLINQTHISQHVIHAARLRFGQAILQS